MDCLYGKFHYIRDEAHHHLFAWKVTGKIELAELAPIIDTIKMNVQTLPKGKIKLLVDNRDMLDADNHPILFNSAINHEWVVLQQWLSAYCTRVAVLCGSRLMMAQMERLARTSGISQILKAYWHQNKEDSLMKAARFLEIDPSSACLLALTEVPLTDNST